MHEVHRPLNILAEPGVPEIAQLQRLAVKRVSVGGGPIRATLALTRRIADGLLRGGSYAPFLSDNIPHAEVNQMLTRR